MTSSLVGSEMCIRDRLNECGESTGLGRQSSEETVVRHGVFAWDRAGFCAVSYTHLTLPTICSV
eukprot:10463380-Prorocentrum_lima.AAC.1